MLQRTMEGGTGYNLLQLSRCFVAVRYGMMCVPGHGASVGRERFARFVDL